MRRGRSPCSLVRPETGDMFREHRAQQRRICAAPASCDPQRERHSPSCVMDGAKQRCPAKWTAPRSTEERHEDGLAGSPRCYTRRVPASAGRISIAAHTDCKPPRARRVSSRVAAAVVADRQAREATRLRGARGDGPAVAMGVTRSVGIRKNGEPVRIADRSPGARRAASEGHRCSASS